MSIERVAVRKFKIEKVDTDKIRKTEKQINDELLRLYNEGHRLDELFENDITGCIDFHFKNFVDTTYDILVSYKNLIPEIEKIQNHDEKMEAMEYLLSKYDNIFEKLRYSNDEESSKQIESLNLVANVVRDRILIEKYENSIGEENNLNGKSK